MKHYRPQSLNSSLFSLLRGLNILASFYINLLIKQTKYK